jgi:hypothetical protein
MSARLSGELELVHYDPHPRNIAESGWKNRENAVVFDILIAWYVKKTDK